MNELIAALADLAKKLGTGIDSLWPHAVRYVVADAATTLALGLLLLSGSAWVCRKLWKFKNEDDDEHVFLLRAGWGIVLFIVTIASLMMIQESIAPIVDPQGYIITKLIAHGGSK